MHINILCYDHDFKPPALLLKTNVKNIQYLLSNVIYKYVYLNNLMNICFIYYFLYVMLKRKIYFSHLRCILSPDLIQIWCTNGAWMWFCDIFSWKWVTHQVIPEKHILLMNCVTVPFSRQTMLLQHKFSKACTFFRGRVIVCWFV